MAAREPEWFVPLPFCREVLNFAFRELEVLPPGTVESLNSYSDEFREAVETVGRAVFTLQLVMRNRLRPLFMDCINIAALMADLENYRRILRFMAQSYLHMDIFNTTLSCFAIVAELILFMNEFGHPIPFYWHPMAWYAIYEHCLKSKLAEEGGWERLLERARQNYTDSNFYTEAHLSYVNNNRIPNAERGRRVNWPGDASEFLRERFGVAPASPTLAMEILRNLYCYVDNLTPFPGTGAREMRFMLGLPNLEEDDDDWA